MAIPSGTRLGPQNMLSFPGAIVLVLVIIGGSPALSQPREDPGDAYEGAVRIYAGTGDIIQAVAGIRTWSIERLEGVVKQYVKRPDAALPAAAALQLEIAINTVIAAPELAVSHLELGQLLLRNMRDRPPHEPHAAPGDFTAFAERWYVVAASTFLVVNDTRHAESFINRGLQVAPASTDLRLLHGIAAEVDALALEQVDWIGSGAEARRIGREWTRLMLAAERDYRRAVKDEPRFARARVRLGRVLTLLGKPAEAQSELERAQADATDPSQQYLAAMFLGSIHEDRGELAAARASYERALSIVPESQAATVALGYLDVMAGRPDRAHALTRDLFSKKAPEDTWWAYRNGGLGLERASLEWIRDWVRR